MSLGYLDPTYIRSSSNGDQVIRLPRSGGFLVKRPIADSTLYDAAAPYPFLVCADWARLEADVRECGRELVSISAVTDPLSDLDAASLGRSFRHLVRPYKEHFVIDLARPLDDFVDPKHVKCARRALRKVSIERCQTPAEHVDEWLHLYAHLVRRHSIDAGAALERDGVVRMLETDGLVMFRALQDDETVGMIICMISQGRVYFHLGAYTSRGYQANASYALVWWIIQYFAEQGFETMNIGAGAGVHGDSGDGLNKFKRGWASGTRLAYLCGDISDPAAYASLAPRAAGDDYFPAYRSPAIKAPTMIDVETS